MSEYNHLFTNEELIEFDKIAENKLNQLHNKLIDIKVQNEEIANEEELT